MGSAHERILVLDFGSQYTQLIARRIREAHVYSEILPYNVPLARILERRPAGLIFSGGPASVYDRKAPSIPAPLLEAGIPILGICYGMQLVTQVLGGKVARAAHREYGPATLLVDDATDLFKGFEGDRAHPAVWMSHGDRIEEMPPGFRSIARTSNSSVAAVLTHRAVGDRLTCLFVDHGLLRQGEAQLVRETFAKHFKMKLRFIDASARFVKALHGVTNPERKRKIIGRLFITEFEAFARKAGEADWLVQGTLYPDVIESVSFKGPSATIKTHHNVGGLPSRMRFKLIEPLRELFKDEVRELGRELGLPDEVLWRQPFPGPGLAIRILGPVSKERLATVRAADSIVEQEIRKVGYYRKVWQAFALLLPVRTVGVMGDERTYDNVVAVRAVTSVDGMTADWARLPAEVLASISTRIINEVKGVNRVVFDVSSKPPSTIEWE